MIQYANILQTGLQSLLAVACGWSCGHWMVLDAEATVTAVNTLVLKVCIPCLQTWLLACHTDMRQPENWRALAIFFLWSVSLQALLALRQLLTQSHLQLDKLGIDSLLLTTNNTGILGPVVLEAAVGRAFAPLGMLATVVLYFQQLPSAQLLFQLHRDRGNCTSSNNCSAGVCHQRQQATEAPKERASPLPVQEEMHQLLSNGTDGATTAARHCSSAHSLYHLQHDHHHQQQQQQQQRQQQPADAECGQLQHPAAQQQRAGTSSSGGSSWSAVADMAFLVFQNFLVWVTGVSLLLSSLGSSLLLDPDQPSALKPLAFLEQLLGWFGQTTAPLTLFTTGLWMQSNSTNSTSMRQQRGQHRGAELASDVAEPGEALSMRQLCMYLLLRCTAAPAIMVLLCWLFGVTGDLAHALVILALLPVAQTAFVVCKAYDTGTHAVSAVMVASLLLMLPQLMLVLALLEWLGVLSGPPAR